MSVAWLGKVVEVQSVRLWSAPEGRAKATGAMWFRKVYLTAWSRGGVAQYPAKLAGQWVLVEGMQDAYTQEVKQASRDQLKLLELPADARTSWPLPRVRPGDRTVDWADEPRRAGTPAARPWFGLGAQPVLLPASQLPSDPSSHLCSGTCP